MLYFYPKIPLNHEMEIWFRLLCSSRKQLVENSKLPLWLSLPFLSPLATLNSKELCNTYHLSSQSLEQLWLQSLMRVAGVTSGGCIYPHSAVILKTLSTAVLCSSSKHVLILKTCSAVHKMWR